MSKVGQNHIYIRFWPTLHMRLMGYTKRHQQSVLPFIAPLRIPTTPPLPQNMSPLSQKVVQSTCVVLYFHPAHVLQNP